MKISFHDIYVNCVVFCLSIFIIFPTGSLLGFPVKKFFLMLMMPIFLVGLFLFKFRFSKYIVGYFLCLISLSFWVLIGGGNLGDFKDPIEEYSFTLSYIIIFLLLIPISEHRASITYFYKALIIISFIYAMMKVCVSLLIFIGYFDIAVFLGAYEMLFGVPLSTLPIPPEGMWRINNANDIFVFTIFAYSLLYWKSFGFNIFFKILWFSVLFLSIYISFSRIGFLIVAISLVVFLFRYKNSMFYGGVFVLLAGVALVSSEGVINGLKDRFSGDATAESNSIKTNQVSFIVGELESSPIIGKGWGVPMDSYIRSEFSPYSYEAQFPSFAYKLGLIGFSIFTMAFVFLFMHLGKMKSSGLLSFNDYIIKCFMLCFFILSCCVNLYYSGVVPAVTLAFIVFNVPKYISFGEGCLSE
ncbi:hypothetical protein [Pseudoalteromonas sp. T1lg75]|uniref:hypothetical protein n=1 Tax=Pseudoalteromonas sp. T1lg75 TaxID=2077102 RepID=UPI000CF63D42|nr:hypothetical protein [Pseudoalteromonas sp. T1lg75]